MAGSGSVGQLVWTPTAGTANFTINYSAAATTNAVGYTGSFTGTTAVGTPQTFNVPWNPIETTTYTVTSISDNFSCAATSLPNATITVTDVAPAYTTAASTPSGLGTAYTPYAYPPSGTTPPAWGIAGGQTITYSNASWPNCTNWGISFPTLNASAPTSNPLKLDITDGTNTNFNTASLRYTGTTLHYFMRGGVMVSQTLNIRCTITINRAVQYIPSGGYFTVKPTTGSNTNLVVNILFETQTPSPAPDFGAFAANSWQPSLTFYNAIHAPSSGAGSAIYSGFTNGFRFFTISPTVAVSASAPGSVCINYPTGGVPLGGPVNLSGGLGSLNTTCTPTYLWSSSAPSLINTTAEDPTPIVNNATSSHLTTYTFTVTSPSDRVCYGTANTAAPIANTTSPTTWLPTTTAGSDNWYNHANWSNCVPCNQTSAPVCQKQAVINASTNYPNINTGTAKATTVVHNATPNKITIAAPTATLKLINP